MIVIDSTQSTDDVAHLLKAQGYEPVTPESAKPKEEAAPPKVETNSSEQTEKPGSESSAAPDSKIATVTEPVETKPQEAQQEPTEVTEEAKADATEAEAKKKPKGGYQVKLEKKTADLDKVNRQLEAARESLEMERGDKAKLQKRIDELQAQHDALAKPATESKAEELVKPKRPLLKDFDFDSDKYEVAMTAHEDAMSDYHKKVAKQEVDQQLKVAEETRKQAEKEAESQRALQEFGGRVEKGKAVYDDFDEIIGKNPRFAKDTGDLLTLVDLEEDAGITKGYIGAESENPAHLIRYLALDALQNDHGETIRLLSLNPYKRVKELARIEAELAAEFETPPVKETPKASEVTPKESVVAPAKPAAIPKPTEAPLRTVGSRSGTAQPNMQELATKDPKAFMKAVMGGQEKRKTSAGG